MANKMLWVADEVYVYDRWRRPSSFECFFFGLQFVFSAKKSGHYLLNLKTGGHLVRGFPTPAVIETGPADPASTILVGVRSSTLVLTAGEEETVAIDPKVREKKIFKGVLKSGMD